MAIYGPFSYTREIKTNGRLAERRFVSSSYRQTAPYVEPLTCKTFFDTCVGLPNPWYADARTNSVPGDAALASPYNSAAYASAYAKLKDSLMPQVNAAVDLAERKQSIDMIAGRASQLYRFSRHLARFQFLQAAESLGLRPTKISSSKRYVRLQLSDKELKLKRSLKSFGKNYLEFHFGWEPLVKDIGEGVELLHSPLCKGNSVRAKSKASVRSGLTSNPTIPDWNSYTAYDYPIVSFTLGATATIESPNLARLNQLGFLNPLVVVWELVPFSFVADWFTNVGQVLESYTDYAGVALSRAYYTLYTKCVRTTWWRQSYPGTSTMVTYPTERVTTHSVWRRPGIGSGPSLSFKQLKLPSVTRAATAVSLLAQFLGTRR